MAFTDSRRPLQRHMQSSAPTPPPVENNVEPPKFNIVTSAVILDELNEKKYEVLTNVIGFDENGICRKLLSELDGFTQMNLEMMYLLGRHIQRTNSGNIHDKRLHTLSRQYLDIVEKSPLFSEIARAYEQQLQQQQQAST